MFSAIKKAWDELFDRSPEVHQPEQLQSPVFEEKKVEPKCLFSRPILKEYMTLKFLLALLEKLPDDDSLETRKGFVLACAIVVKLMQKGEYPDVLVWLDEHPEKPTGQKLQRVVNFPRLKPFWVRHLDAPDAIPNLLKKLSAHEGSEYINQCLFSVMKAGKFTEMAEWFLAQQSTSEAKSLREKLTLGLPRNKQPWYDLLYDTKTTPLFDNRFPLKPHLMHGATLKGFKELHPFEMLLGEYLRLKVINNKKVTGLFGVYKSLRTAESAVFDNMETVREELRFAGRASAEKGVIDSNLASLYQLACLGEDEFSREALQASIKAQKDLYYKKYLACIQCGAPRSLALLESNLDAKLYYLRQLEETKTSASIEFVNSLIEMVENGLRCVPSSIAYFYCAAVYRRLGQYCTMITRVPRDSARRKPEVLNFNTVMLQKNVNPPSRSPKETEYMNLRDTCFSKAIYYITIAASLSPYCEAIEYNTFQNEGLRTTNLFSHNRYGDDLSALARAYQDDMRAYFCERTLRSTVDSAQRDVESLVEQYAELHIVASR